MPTYDLTRRVEPGMPTYPGDPPVRVAPAATFEADGYRVSELRLGSHAGTHVDAPSHTEPDGRTLGSFPVDAFRFEARLIDCRGRGPRSAIARAHLRAAFEADADGEPAADAVVLDTGWAVHWGTDRMFDHPYLTRGAAAWCAERGLSVATDALSVDPTPGAGGGSEDHEGAGGGSEDHEGAGGGSGGDEDPPGATGEPTGVPAHHELLGGDRLVIENLTNLGGLPSRFVLRAYPLALDADGAPVRAVAETGAAGGSDRAGGTAD